MHHPPIGTSIPEAVRLIVFHTQFLFWDSTFCNRIVNRLFSKLPQRLQRGVKHLKPIIDSRREEQEKIGNGYEKPVGFLTSLTASRSSTLDDFYQLDLLMWLMEAAQGEEQTIENLTRRVLAVNFAAIQASSVVNPNLYLHIIPYSELIEGIPDIRAYPLLFGRPTRIHWASSRGS